MGQPHQAKLRNQPCRGIPPPHRVPPTLGQKRVETVLDPPVELMKEPPDMRFAIEGAPPTNHGIDSLNQFPQLDWDGASSEVTDLLLEPLNALLAWDGIEVVGIGVTATFLRRQPCLSPVSPC